MESINKVQLYIYNLQSHAFNVGLKPAEYSSLLKIVCSVGYLLRCLALLGLLLIFVSSELGFLTYGRLAYVLFFRMILHIRSFEHLC